MGQPIVRGRSITEQDTATTRNIAVVSEAFAKRFFPDQDPIGKHFGLDLPKYNTTFEIVGVVRDAKYRDPGGPPRPMFYAPLAQHVVYDQPVMALSTTAPTTLAAPCSIAGKRHGHGSAHPQGVQ